MKAIIGLGNPEPRYDKTRHNIGFEVIDRLADKHQVAFRTKRDALVGEWWVGQEKVLLVKPLTYMNRSGEAVRDLVEYHQMEIEDVLVIYDDVDLDPGKIRIRPYGSAGTHNGMRSIIYQLKNDGMPRLRIGVGKPEFGDLASYVLGKFTKEEEPLMKEAVDRAANAVEIFLEDSVQEAMNQYNG